MITLNNVGAAGQALQYYVKDNYYTENEGLEASQWYGRAAAQLGLEGRVDKKSFFELLTGVVGAHDLGRYARNEDTGEIERVHRPATDMTFSAPKSVSLLAEVHGDSAVRAAHEASVHAALAYVERALSTTRQMRDGELHTALTGNLAVAMFRHNTSRELDPQTHTHAVIVNATQRSDGQWRSLDNQQFFTSQRLVNAIYMGELAGRLQALGYQLSPTDAKGNFEVAGFTREQLAVFSRRREEIDKALSARGLSLATASAQQKEDAALATRAKKVNVDHPALQKDWQQRALAEGIDLLALSQEASRRRGHGDSARADSLNGRQALEFAAAHLIEREAVVKQDDMLRIAIEHGYGRVLPDQVLAAYQQLVQEGRLVPLADGNVTTAKMLDLEVWTLEQVRDTQRQGERILGRSAILERLGSIEQRDGRAFGEGQREAIVLALSSHDRYVAVQGLSGTGKTTMQRGMRELAEGAGYRVRGMAPTGSAAKVMAGEAGIDSDTVAMFMIKERQLQRDIAFAQQFAEGFQRQKELWLVDESSFLSQRQMARLDYMAAAAGAKVVYLGDKFQLHGVEAGKPFEMGQVHGMETAYMSGVTRQKTGTLVAMVDTLTGKDQLPPGEPLTQVESMHTARAFDYIDRAGLIRELPADQVIPALARTITEMPAAERQRTMVITVYNLDRLEINKQVRCGLQEKGELSTQEQPWTVYVSKGWTRAMIREAQYYQPGDVVRMGRSYAGLDAEKGDYLQVTGVAAERGVVNLRRQDGVELEWQPRRQAKVEVYDAEQRLLAVGDRIRMTRADGQLKNGDMADVVALERGVAGLRLFQQGEPVAHPMVLDQHRHWDHDYASTIHGAQGATRQRTLLHIPAPEKKDPREQKRALERMARVFGDRSFYVGATRASHELVVFTNNKQGARDAVLGRQEKSSAVEAIEADRQMQQASRRFIVQR